MDDTQVYTVRLWRHAGQWRAAVRAVGEEASQLFTEPAQLAAWLLAPRPDGASPAGCGQTPVIAAAPSRPLPWETAHHGKDRHCPF